MHARTVFMTALVGGPILGSLAGLAIDPTMVPPPEPPWRHPAKAVVVPAAAYYQIEAPPEDLTPHSPPPGFAAILARRQAAERRHAELTQVHAARAAEDDDGPLAGEAASQAGLEAVAADVVAADSAVVDTLPDPAPAELRIVL